MVCFKIEIVFEDKGLVRARPDFYNYLTKQIEGLFNDGRIEILRISIERLEGYDGSNRVVRNFGSGSSR